MFAVLRSRWTTPFSCADLECRGNLTEQVKRVLQRERSAGDQLGQRFSRDELHHQVVDTLGP